MFLKVSFKDGPRHALLMGWWAYTSKQCELHYNGEKGSLFVGRRLQPITCQIQAPLGFRSVKLARKAMVRANVMHPIHHRASPSPRQPPTGVSTATAARRILQDDGVVKGQLRAIYFCWSLQWSPNPILEQPISFTLFSSNMLDIWFPLSDNSTVSWVI